MGALPREYPHWAAADPVDTDLSFLRFFELDSADISERRMTAHRVVDPLDIVEHVSPCLRSGQVLERPHVSEDTRTLLK